MSPLRDSAKERDEPVYGRCAFGDGLGSGETAGPRLRRHLGTGKDQGLSREVVRQRSVLASGARQVPAVGQQVVKADLQPLCPGGLAQRTPERLLKTPAWPNAARSAAADSRYARAGSSPRCRHNACSAGLCQSVMPSASGLFRTEDENSPVIVTDASGIPRTIAASRVTRLKGSSARATGGSCWHPSAGPGSPGAATGTSPVPLPALTGAETGTLPRTIGSAAFRRVCDITCRH